MNNADSTSPKAIGTKERTEAASAGTPLKKVLLFLARLTGILASFLLLAIAAWLHLSFENAVTELLSIVCAEVGAVLLSISILHIAYELYLRRQYERELRVAFRRAVRRELRNAENLRSIVEATREDNQRYRSFLNHGVEEILDFTSHKMSRELKHAKRIRILKTWFPEDNLLQSAFEEALENSNTRVELLLCDPEYELLNVRSSGASLRAEEGRRRVIDALESIRKVRCHQPDPIGCFDPQNKNCNTRVGLYNAWPGCPVIWCDDRIFLGFYFMGRSSLRSPWMRIQPESPLAKALDQQFTLLWKHERTLVFESGDNLGHWLAPFTETRKEKKGFWKRRKSKKPKRQAPSPEVNPEPSTQAK